MENKTKILAEYLDKHFYVYLLCGLGILNVAPILAPVFAAIGLTLPAQIIYFVYSFLCHQLDWRSLHVFDYQYAWCVRCTFIWLNIFFVALLTLKYKIRAIKWYWVIPFIIPIALDGGIQTVATIIGFMHSDPYYISTNFTRMLTGAFFGMGIGLWIMPSLWESSSKKDNRREFKIKTIYFVLLAMILNLLLYIALVYIWNVTSIKYPPVNFLDYVTKMPISDAQWLIRRLHGV